MIEGELLLIWGRQDPHIPRAGRRLIHEALDPVLARQCLDLALELFRRRLGDGR